MFFFCIYESTWNGTEHVQKVIHINCEKEKMELKEKRDYQREKKNAP
jgi:hypothetical protein